MKRFRITSSDQRTHIIPFFNSAEALYLWCNDLNTELDEALMLDLRSDEFVDLEWLGCEFVYEGGIHTCLNYVNVGWAREASNASGYVIKQIQGWVTNDILPLRNTTIHGLTIRQLSDNEGVKLMCK